ncbi:MAG: L-histidine N(alpha)-methyltransferase [Pseudomonadota bacterium]
MNPTLDADLIAEVLAGLTQTPKRLSPRWLYDRLGSELFEAITELPEYYLTRTEGQIFEDHLGDMAEEIGPGAVIVEYGAGALVKTRALLDGLESPAAYVPIDVSGPFLKDAAKSLSEAFPGLIVAPIVADFTGEIDLSGLPGAAEKRVGFFPGSTIGNLTNDEILTFLSRARKSLGPEGRFLLGADMKKDPRILQNAYDDRQGVTAKFILNGLAHLNTALGTTFDLDAFRYEAVWNEAASRMELYLVAERATQVSLANHAFSMPKGERILMEISRKFELSQLSELAATSNWKVERVWQDQKGYFSLILFS